MNLPIYQFILGALFSYIIILFILPYLQQILIDAPNYRSSHKLPTPRGGGLSFVIVGTILNLIFSTGLNRWIPVFCLPLAFIGIVDDYMQISSLFRYLIQLSTALTLLFVARLPIHFWEVPIYLLLITAIINFFNFMDGLDGMLAGCSIPILAASSSWSLSGSVFGFLLWNWCPAKVFMGDIGSTFLGAVFAGIAFQQSNLEDVLSLLLVAFPLFADTSICILRRFLQKKNIFLAHKQHLYQRLNQAGWSHSRVASLYLAATALLVLVRELNSFPLFLALLLSELLIGYLLDKFVAVKFKPS